MSTKHKITIVGAGYVGMSLAVLLAQNNKVIVLDIDKERIQKINKKKSTVKDNEVEKFLSEKTLFLSGTLNKQEAFDQAEFIIITTPTDFNNKSYNFDTSSVDSVTEDALSLNKSALVIIRSTLPIGHTEFLRKKYSTERIIYSPEFLREGKALMDNLYPSRIVVGGECDKAKNFLRLLKIESKNKDVETMLVHSSEAEAIKLFSNTYLAMRVAFFNELDTFSIANDLDVSTIINGISLDPRIGSGYNNPSFGYGGYCLPKDAKQLHANYKNIPQTMIKAILSSNKARKDFIAEQIIKRGVKTIGFYRLAMKVGADNFRSSATIEIIKKLKSADIRVLIYEPLLNEDSFLNYKVISSLRDFKSASDLIVANRATNELKDVESKIFTRDVFGTN
jgi:UDPglucose 6-dehydrogenase